MGVMFFFFFKRKTAYEMRISDWSSDVCSSDLRRREGEREVGAGQGLGAPGDLDGVDLLAVGVEDLDGELLRGVIGGQQALRVGDPEGRPHRLAGGEHRPAEELGEGHRAADGGRGRAVVVSALARAGPYVASAGAAPRSEERRVGKGGFVHGRS